MGLTRRQALGFLGAAGAATLVAVDGRSRLWAACTVTPDAVEGPYFVDELLNRSDIRIDPSDGSTQAGIPLRLTINVLRADADCAPAAGVQVDLWHCDAAGLYSDESANGTVGKMFLRGYQVTDGAGAVRFTTIYPGWYPGRTIHIHFKVRAFDGAATSYEFTSQLFFDDAVTAAVVTQAPYAQRGTPDTSNAADAIYGGRTALRVALANDGSGGYTGSFDVALEGLPTTGGGGGTCSDLATCRAALTSTLPDPTDAADRKSRRTARTLARLDARAGGLIDRAVSASGARQTKRYTRARAVLTKFKIVATNADAHGSLGVPLYGLLGAVDAVLALLPAG